MAKVTGQFVPPELEALFHALTSPAKVTQGPDGTLQMKKNKKKPSKPKRQNYDLRAFKELAEIVWTAQGKSFSDPGAAFFIFNLTRDLIMGVVSEKYFRKLKVLQARTLESIPGGYPDPDPPPYGYRTPNFLPTVSVYPNGTTTTLSPAASGQKSAGYFYDTFLRWRKIEFLPKDIHHPDILRRCLLQWNTNILMIAGSRGSRPMASLHIKAALAKTGAASLTVDEPPIMKKTSLYWRFKIPQGVPPYYTAEQFRRITKPLVRFAKPQGVPPAISIVVDAANRPMMGRGFNNNDYVLTSFESDPILWEVTDCFPGNAEVLKHLPYLSSDNPADIAYSPKVDRFVACGDTYFNYTTDIVNWSRAWSGIPALWRTIIYCPGIDLFISVGRYLSAGRIATSQAGKVWTIITPPITAILNCCAWSEKLGIAVALGSGATGNVACWSTDGVSWFPASFAESFAAYEVIWVDELNKFVASGTGGAVYAFMTSTDGKSWTRIYNQPNGGSQAIAWSPSLGMLVATTPFMTGNIMMTSSTGDSWTEAESGFESSFSGIAWCPPRGEFIAAGGGGTDANLIASDSGSGWHPLASGTSKILGRVRWIEEKCVLFIISGAGALPHFIRTDKATP